MNNTSRTNVVLQVYGMGSNGVPSRVKYRSPYGAKKESMVITTQDIVYNEGQGVKKYAPAM